MKINLKSQSYREFLLVNLYPKKYMSFTNLPIMDTVITLFVTK